MAISTFGLDEVGSKSPSSSNLKGNATNMNQLAQIIAENEDITAAARQRKLNRIKELRSPYVIAERGVQFLSGITERKIVHKRPQNFKSSFPLATRIYRANSDEFKIPKRTSKKVKKSVLTLPNDSTISPCTVSDLNEREYQTHNQSKAEHKLEVKRVANQRREKRERKKAYVLYDDRDARHAELNCSSDETIKHGGDYKIARKGQANNSTEEEFKAHDVWAVLRNINRFQFKPLPPESGESSSPATSSRSKKKKIVKRYKNSERRLIETCRTEQISYIASFEIDDRKTVRATCGTSQSRSTTSMDRVTVISNDDAGGIMIKPGIKLQNIKAIRPNQANNKVVPRNVNRHTPRIHTRVKENKMIPMNERYKMIKGQPTNANHSQDSIMKESFITATRDSDDSSNYDRCKFIEEDDGYQTYENRLVKSSNYVAASRCQSPHFKSGKSPIRTFEKVDNMRGAGRVAANTDRNESPVRGKSCLVTTMPSAAAMPKLSPNDIKRKLSLMRFPIVVLGRDQLSSTMEVPDYEACQFDGLDKQVWPYMVEWSKKPTNNKSKCNKHNTITSNHPRKINNDTAFKAKDKRYHCDVSNNTKKAEPNKRSPQNVSVAQPVHQLKKPKSISQIKDKMFKLLYKKSVQNMPDSQVDNKSQQIVSNEPLVELVGKADAFTETKNKCDIVPKAPEQLILPYGGNEKIVSMPMKNKRPWAKGKWASEFIENVIRKIRNGSYYSHDINKICSPSKRDKQFDHKTVSIRTTSDSTTQNTNDSCDKFSDLSLITDVTEPDPLAAIPGFDEAFTDLKIDSLTMSQISIKHSVTNVVLQFDVIVQNESPVTVELRKSLDSSITPLPMLNESQVFKCPNTFMNAMLPAELCTILPRIKREFIDSKVFASFARLLSSTETDLNLKSSQSNIISSLPRTLRMRTIIPDGEFARLRYTKTPTCSNASIEKAIRRLRSESINIRELFSMISIKGLMFALVNPNLNISFKEIKSIEPDLRQAILPVLPETRTFTALQLYKANDRPVLHFDIPYFMHILQSLNKYTCLTLSINSKSVNQTLTVTNDINDLRIGGTADPIGQKIVTITINKIEADALFNGFAKKKALTDSKITEIDTSDGTEDDKELIETHRVQQGDVSSDVFDGTATRTNDLETKRLILRNVTCNKTNKRRGYIKLYKKCKSTSSISGEKSSVALSKVTNLDDFFQALGISKTLSSVFDGCVGRKILSAVDQMKSWITEITPRQVMLVLLLTNKKDTPNLVRYRPVLLQGIAVNRITRASELDMEIEVIERENLDNLTQFNGYPIQRCIENNDSLFDELCWIAKTTASDYQKPFDESSEKLLKSLLQKRKKLNPSYLRVMARYVGLGLLKSQAKN